jgi:hypothetical protein
LAVTLTERNIFLTRNDGNFDESSILADSSIQGATNLAAGTAIQLFYHSYLTLSGGVYTQHPGLQLTWYLSSANDATVVSGINAFASRWTDYTVFTWSKTITFGV